MNGICITKSCSILTFIKLDDLLQMNPGIVMQQIRICNPRDEGDMVSKVLVIFGVHDNVNVSAFEDYIVLIAVFISFRLQ